MNEGDRNLIQRRPAEATTFAGGVAIVAAYFLGVDDPGVILAMAGVLAALPAIVTGIVASRRS